MLFAPPLVALALLAAAGPDLEIRKDVVAGGMRVGAASAPWVIRVTNVGASPTAGTIVVTDTVPAALPFDPDAFAAAQPSPDIEVSVDASNRVTFSIDRVLAPGDAIALPVTVTAADRGLLRNSATVSAAGDADPSNDSVETSTALVVVPAREDIALARAADDPVASVVRR